MAIERAMVEEVEERVHSWGRRHPVLRIAAIGLLSLLLLLSAAIWMLDSAPGHRLIADRIGALRPGSGLRIRIGRIDGSIWSRATLRDLRLYDTRGLFLEAPEIALDWRPTTWVANKLWIRSAQTDLLILHRLPALRPSPKKGPLLPGFDIHVGKLHIGRLRLEPPVSGRRQAVRLDASADIHAGRVLLKLDAASTARDRLNLQLDSEPDRDRFDLDAKLIGPADGVIAGMTGWKKPVDGVIAGKGRWTRWKGRATLDVGDVRLIELALTADRGRYALDGTLEPTSFLSGKLQRLTAPIIGVKGAATLADRQLNGSLALRSPAIELAVAGTLDLANSAFRDVTLDARLFKPPAFFPNMTGRNIRLHASFDGPFGTADYGYALTADHAAFDTTGFDAVRAEGKGKLSDPPVRLPVRLSARRVTGVGDVAGGILGNLRVDGVLLVTAQKVTGRGLKLRSDRLSGDLSLVLDLRTGVYDVGLSGKLLRYFIPGIGIVDVSSDLKVMPGAAGRGTMVAGRGRAWVRRFDNGFLRSLAGGLPSIDTRLRRGPDGILHFERLVLTGPEIRISGNGYRRRDGTFYFKGSGQQARYGPLQMTLDGNISRPKIDLLLASPMPALGLANVTVKLDPTAQGFDYSAEGGSRLGPWGSRGAVLLPAGQPATIAVTAVAVSGAKGSGSVRSDPGGFTGRIDLGSDGTISGPLIFSVERGLQKIEAHLRARRATLGGPVAVTIGRGRLDGTMLLDPAGLEVNGNVALFGTTMKGVTLGRGRAAVALKGGNGSITANLAGARGRGFQLTTVARLAGDSVTVTAEGAIDRRPIRIETPAVFNRDGDGWRLDPATLAFAGGKATVAGRFGGSTTEVKAGVQSMPLSVLDIFYPELGLSGIATGDVDYRIERGARIPTGRANLKIRGLSRSGLVLTSRPADVALAAVLTDRVAAGRAIVSSGGKVIGRGQARITNLPSTGDLPDRLSAGQLFAQLRYGGPADTLWRLFGIETIDISGPVSMGADISGSGANPVIRGSLRSTQARMESAVTGMVISNIAAAGRFDGSRLVIDKLSGQTRGGGTISGRAAFDFAAPQGLGMDVAVDAQNAQLLNRDDIGATVTGPLTISSDGNGGTIAGDVRLVRGRFQLGRAAAVATIPQFETIELNRPDDDDDLRRRAPWKLAIKVDSRNQLAVTGLGLDSEWRGKLDLGGTIENPAINGRVDLVRGGYEFAGRRFDLDRGSIRFLGETPPDPLLDITARANLNGVSATISVTGTGLKPEIRFTSIPALPEDELLSRLLFGTSITNLSAPEALQLAAAVGSLRGGGGGLNPINAVRRAAGLDRLRILPADPTIGTGTAIAAGKYIGRRTYVEVISDGQGYSATRVEFQITRWLSLLSSISTIGRQSASVKVSKDY
ncbi:translocation/assembly module TamB domain-containing protein [Sphingomonadaceae bacterium G21617-S1]|nr:translocation/assembly module TamB domain-containing protein [Sphingomonadaceae bacterium G21617-S1]